MNKLITIETTEIEEDLEKFTFTVVMNCPTPKVLGSLWFDSFVEAESFADGLKQLPRLLNEKTQRQ